MFYTSVIQDGKYILCRGVANGKRFERREVYKPRLYMRGDSNGGPWRNLQGHPLREFQFNDIWEARDFSKKYEGVSGMDVYGNQRWLYAWIADTFPGHIDYEPTHIRAGTIDIEVDSTNGFPEPQEASEQITAITLHCENKYHVFGTGDFVPKDPNWNGIYVKCENELEMIDQFLCVWTATYPDILTGWNCRMFDLPYLVNRIIKLLGEEKARLLSPWGKIEPEEINIGFKVAQIWHLYGIAVLDYFDMYKKYAPSGSQESYKLDNIARVELNRGKVDYSQYGTLPHEVAAKNYQLFIEYNIDDVVIVVEMEKKLRLLELAMTLAYMTKTNFEDVFSQGRMWDAIIFNKLKERFIAVPPQPRGKKETQYAGAYVKEPIPGLYRWLASFDLTSLYPHLIMMYNLSPETLVKPEEYDEQLRILMSRTPATVEMFLQKKADLKWLKDHNLTITPNGQVFRTDIQGFLPEIMDEMFAERAKHKKQELAYKSDAEKTHDKAKKDNLKMLAAREKAIQSALKVCLNSAYGSIGNAYFRYFDIRIAEAITLSGQLSIQWIQKAINDYFNKLLKTDSVDYILASDTDSVYISMDSMVQRLLPDLSDTKSVIETMDRICEQKIKPFIDRSYAELSDYVNSRPGKMVMKREALVDVGIWCAKKNYILSVWDNEGVKYEKPDIKITGWAAVRTTTPKICRNKLKEVVGVILTSDENTTRKFVNKFRDEFMQLSLDQIACPSGITELASYSDPDTIYVKGTMMHIKGALIYNHYLQKMGLTKRYELINPKSKIKYVLLKEPNPLFVPVVAFVDRLPDEFNLTKYIDKDAQFEKTFISPLNIVLDAIKWKLDRPDDLSAFFS